jgi:multidrug efflux pump subunit AcrA (membrane-fusion protein)
VLVSREARANLGLEVAAAELRPIESSVAVIGELEPLPDRTGAVTSRIAGRITWVGVAEGDLVRKGAPVVEVESLQLGDPPPSVRYAAPLSGRVIDRHVALGSSVEPNAHLLEVAQLDEVLAVGQLFEGQIGAVRVGQKARVRVASYPDLVLEGVVERVGSALDPATRSLPLYVRVRNPDGKLLPGMRAELSVVIQSSDAALAIPRSALLGEFGDEFVFVERDAEKGVFERTPIVRGIGDDGFAEVIEGLLPGDRVVTVGNYSLQFLPAYGSDEASSEALADAADHAHPPAQGRGKPRWTTLAAALAAIGAIAGAIVWTRRRAHGRA